ncbi:hypothetical protein [Kocuria atrinae]|uniref:hypothetical protein n=1 Tax=Kocuria atrinae TaxID=592377 RepID=UPI00036E7122|nr:hypothetical protein [Kocuria atrinae]
MEQTDRVLKAVGAWLFLIVLSVAAAAVTIALVNKYQYGPETDVKAYFDALQAGDAPQLSACSTPRSRIPTRPCSTVNRWKRPRRNWTT